MANTKKKTTKKKESKKEILRKLGDPNLSSAKKNELLEKLYRGIDIK